MPSKRKAKLTGKHDSSKCSICLRQAVIDAAVKWEENELFDWQLGGDGTKNGKLIEADRAARSMLRSAVQEFNSTKRRGRA